MVSKTIVKVDKIEYLGLAESNMPEVVLNTIDQIENIEILNNKLNIEYSRRVECNPRSIFSVYVKCVVTKYFTDGKKIDKEKIKNDIEKNPGNYVNVACAIASNLISSIIVGTGRPPAVTPPGFIKSK